VVHLCRCSSAQGANLAFEDGLELALQLSSASDLRFSFITDLLVSTGSTVKSLQAPLRTTSGVSLCFPLGYRWADSVLSGSPHHMQLYLYLFQLHLMIHSFQSAFSHTNKNSDLLSTFKMFQVANCSSKIFELSPMNFIVVESNKAALDQHSVNTHMQI
jgi:hypothetical protein